MSEQSTYEFKQPWTNDTGEAIITIKLPNGVETETKEEVVPEPEAKPVKAKGKTKNEAPEGTVVSGETAPSDQATGKFFKEPPCEVSVSLGCTINTGNYSSARADVMIRVPCAHGEIDKVYDFAKNWVDARLASIAKDIKENHQVK